MQPRGRRRHRAGLAGVHGLVSVRIQRLVGAPDVWRQRRMALLFQHVGQDLPVIQFQLEQVSAPPGDP